MLISITVTLLLAFVVGVVTTQRLSNESNDFAERLGEGGIADMNIPSWFLNHPNMYFKSNRQIYHPSKKSIDISGSKSQFFEEGKAIKNYFTGVTEGTFLELGALDGQLYSNSIVLENSMKWKGILIEGSPKSYKALQTNRPEQITLNAAICDTQKPVHYLESGHSCCRGVVDFMPVARREHVMKDIARLAVVPCVPLRFIFDKLDVQHISMFFLDVEGAEMSVLNTIDFDRIKFDVLCIEGGKDREKSYVDFLSPKGYRIVNDTKVKKRKNTWFIRNSFQPPMSITDRKNKTKGL